MPKRDVSDLIRLARERLAQADSHSVRGAYADGAFLRGSTASGIDPAEEFAAAAAGLHDVIALLGEARDDCLVKGALCAAGRLVVDPGASGGQV